MPLIWMTTTGTSPIIQPPSYLGLAFRGPLDLRLQPFLFIERAPGRGIFVSHGKNSRFQVQLAAVAARGGSAVAI